MFKGIRQILVIACGTCTSVIAALLLALSVVKLRIAIHYFTLWGVFPLGAILAGFAAASGYRFGARILRQPPGRPLLAAVMATSVGTVFLTCYIPYALIVGNSLSTAAGFGTFLNLAIHAQSVNFMGLGATGPLGRLGYVFFSLQVLGFALGGGLLYGTLSTRAYCKTCRRYHVPQLSIVRYCPSEYEAATAFRQTGTLLSHGHGFLACQLTSSLSEVEANSHCMVEFGMWHCPGCSQESYVFTCRRRDGKRWQLVPELSAQGLAVKQWLQASRLPAAGALVTEEGE